jgi:hypothetical protein
MIRYPLLALLLMLEPIVRIVLYGLTLLSILSALVLGVSGHKATAPYVGAFVLTLCSGLILIAYDGALRRLSGGGQKPWYAVRLKQGLLTRIGDVAIFNARDPVRAVGGIRRDIPTGDTESALYPQRINQEGASAFAAAAQLEIWTFRKSGHKQQKLVHREARARDHSTVELECIAQALTCLDICSLRPHL